MKIGAQLAESWQRNIGHLSTWAGGFGEFFSRNRRHLAEMFKGQHPESGNGQGRWGGGA